MVLFGVGFTGFSLVFLLVAWLSQAGPIFLLFGLPFLLAGLAMIGAGVWTLLLKPVLIGRYFGTPSAVLSPDHVRIGETVGVQYVQPVRRDIQVRAVRVQLILRERAIRRHRRRTYTSTCDPGWSGQTPGHALYLGARAGSSVG